MSRDSTHRSNGSDKGETRPRGLDRECFRVAPNAVSHTRMAVRAVGAVQHVQERAVLLQLPRDRNLPLFEELLARFDLLQLLALVSHVVLQRGLCLPHRFHLRQTRPQSDAATLALPQH